MFHTSYTFYLTTNCRKFDDRQLLLNIENATDLTLVSVAVPLIQLSAIFVSFLRPIKLNEFKGKKVLKKNVLDTHYNEFHEPILDFGFL